MDVEAETYCWMVTLPEYVIIGEYGRPELPSAAFDAGRLVITIPDDIYT